MTHKTLNWAWGVRHLTAPQKFLLVALADFADEDNSCFPGQGTLAEMTSAGKRSVVSNLQVLERLDYIRRERRNRDNGSRTSDRFYLQVGFQHDQGADSAPNRQGASDDALGASGDSQGASDGEDKVHQVQGQKNPQGNHQKEPPVDPPDVREKRDALFETAWLHWPRKTSGRKEDARKKFHRFKASEVMVVAQAIVTHGDAYAQHGYGQFCPVLSNWIERKQWTDDVPGPRNGDRRPSAQQQKMNEGLDLLARMRAEDQGGEQRALEG